LKEPPKLSETEKKRLLRIIVINVNETDIGDANLIITPSGKTMLIDAGMPKCGTNVVLPFLKERGVCVIDWLMSSHHHDDHFGGIPEIIRSNDISVKEVIWSPLPFEKMHKYEEFYAKVSQDIADAIEAACAQRGVPIHKPREGQVIDLGDGVKGEILAVANSALEMPTNYINNNSIVMRLRLGNFSMLFTGDQGFEEEDYVMTRGKDVRSDVLRIAHHAGAGSTGVEFVKTVNPLIGISSMPKWLSSDERGLRVYNQLKPTGIKLYRTWEHGNIEVQTDGAQYWVITQKQSVD